MTKVRRYYTDETETHNARNVEQIAGEHNEAHKRGGFCKTCQHWSSAVTAEKNLCKHCEKRSEQLG